MLAAGLLLELALLVVASATGALTESRGFRDAFAAAAPAFVWASLEAIRRGLTGLVGALGGPRDATQAAAVVLVWGLALAGASYAVALLSRPRAVWAIVTFGVLFELTLLAMPGLLSTDLLTYATYGRLGAVYGQNPYLAAPSAAPSDPLVQWLDTRPEHASPYGPLWTLLSMLVAWLTAGLSPLGQALSYRVLGVLAMLAGAAIVWRLTRQATAVLLFAWNPLLLVETVGNGHNDGLMMVIALGGLLLLSGSDAVARRPAALALRPQDMRLGVQRASGGARGPVVGLVLIGLAALIKYVPGLLLVYAGLALARARPRLVASTAVVLAGLAVALWLPWLASSGPGVVLTSVSAGGERYVNSLVDLPTGWLATHVVDRSGRDVAAAEAAVRVWPRTILRVLFLAYVAGEAARLWRRRDLRAAVAAATRGYLVALLLVGTQVLSWYFSWPLALAAGLGWGSTLARIAVAYGVAYLPVFYAIHADLVPGELAGALLLAWAILPLLALAAGARVARGWCSLRSRRRVEGRCELRPRPGTRDP